ncbi:MAG: peptide-methionine (S)-S-oxide reductase MsrA [Acidobacteriota bacterium]
MSIFIKIILAVSLGVAAACAVAKSSPNITDISDLPPVATPENASPAANGPQKAVFAGGCFWGLDAVFKHVKGVTKVTSGYSGGTKETADYETVSTGKTGHAESVEVTFDPAKVTYQQLLYVFFAVAHDPTELNYQGPDHGTQYRSVIFFTSDEQKKTAEDFIAAIDKSKALSKPVVTQVVPFQTFYPAEDYHQNYLALHPDEPYIVYNDKPKVAALKEKFPNLYTER